jgi:hypothetical protein
MIIARIEEFEFLPLEDADLDSACFKAWKMKTDLL